MIHPPVDLQRWLARYPIAQWRAGLKVNGAPDFQYLPPDFIHSPRELALTEQFREEGGCASWIGGVPVDLLLPALGEPPQSRASKVGGIPHRPRSAPWPRAGSEPMLFLAQFCLADSRDLLTEFIPSDLPGDVLLMFCENNGDLIWSEREGARMHFEWQPLELRDPMTKEDVPAQAFQWTPTHFQRLRSADFPNIPYEEALDVPRVYPASKVGGSPNWQQGPEEADSLGRYFASLQSINPAENEYPFPNVETPPWGNRPDDQGFLMLGDVGTLFLFAKGNGRVGWLMQCG